MRNHLARRLFPALITLACVMLAPLSAGSLPMPGPDDPLAATKAEIQRLISASGAETVGIAVYDPETKKTLFLNERTTFHAASTMKVPVMMEIFRRMKEKKLRLDDEIEVRNAFRSIIDGSEYRLSRADDSDEEVYHRIGQKMTIADLLDHMITWSSNLATNILIEKAGADSVMALMKSLGANDIQVLRGVEDSKAFQAGKNNTTTAYDMMLLLQQLAERRFLNGKACDAMINILAAQHFNDGIPAGLPRGTRVAHKTGSITRHNHDAAIVFPPGRKPYVIVVLTRGIADEKRSHKLIAGISGVVWKALVGGM
ncbi:MAG: serine hydrolase [Blastocatellia bacterium]